MAWRNRAEVVVADEIGVYHCVQPVVRRAFLCGVDPLSGSSYDHRRTWIRDRLESLSELFGVEIAAFAVLTIHVHVILRNRPDVVSRWSDQEVSRQWLTLFPGRVATKLDTATETVFSWSNGRPGPIDTLRHFSHAARQGTSRPTGACGRDAECGSGIDGDDPSIN